MPEAVIIATARTPIGRARKGTLTGRRRPGVHVRWWRHGLGHGDRNYLKELARPLPA